MGIGGIKNSELGKHQAYDELNLTLGQVVTDPKTGIKWIFIGWGELCREGATTPFFARDAAAGKLHFGGSTKRTAAYTKNLLQHFPELEKFRKIAAQ